MQFFNTEVLIAVALCATAISFTLTMTSMFKWFRESLSSLHPKVEDLVHCPWCISHWIILVILLTSDVELIKVSFYSLYNFLFTLFVLVGLTGLFHFVLLRAYRPVSEMMMNRRMEQMEAKVEELVSPDDSVESE